MSSPEASRIAAVALSIALFTSVFAPIFAAPAAANVTGEPNISLTAGDNRLSAGETTQLQVSVINRGEVTHGSSQGNVDAERRVTTARGVTVNPESEGPITVRSAETAVGNLPDGNAIPVGIQLSVDENADPGTYRIPIEVSYEYTPFIGERGQNSQRDETEIVQRSVKVVVDEEADFEVRDISAPAPGDTGAVELELTNAGEAAANDAVVSLESLTGDLQLGATGSSEAYVDRWEPGENRTVTLSGSVTDGAGIRALPASLSVEYTDDNDVPFTSRSTVGVTPDTGGVLAVAEVDSTAGPGEQGEIGITLEHTGEESLEDVTVDLTSREAGLTFGAASNSASAYIGSIEPGEQRTVTVGGQFAENARTRGYAVDMAIGYDTDETTGATQRNTVGVVPDDDQTFTFENVDSSLRVSQDGTLRGTFTNVGPNAVENVVVTLDPPNQNVEVLEPQVALGDLDSGESVDVSFDVEVASAARAGPRQFSLRTNYETLDDDERQADPIQFRQSVEPRRDVFGVEARNTNVSAGEESRIVLAVTNQRNETVTDVSAKLFASSPLSTSDDEAYIAELEPGETVEVPFRVSASGSAMQKDYPVSVDFQYVDAAGETRLSESYRVPVSVQESGGGLFGSVAPASAVGFAPLLLVPLAPLALRLRRRR
ncbi:COG1361 S-layer family protein [Natronomonas sp. CBA1123]|uniref:COG1361 S-layer family protein n=1 Tax=Natronomonas sp. CBA1123 TaxID=2668070 RepID=UPI0018D2577B|nr:NEW3 domain-containing protein [Natronomonas sp. CBA1123]